MSGKKKLVAVYCEIMVSKDIVHNTRVSCFTHEIPIYRARFKDRVELCENQPVKTKEIASVSAEYRRLERKHGSGESGNSMVEEIFGNQMVGTLARTIGMPAGDLLAGAEDAEEYEQLNTAPPVKEKKDVKPKAIGSPTPTNMTKKAVESWLNDRKIEYSDDMGKDELLAWTNSVLPQYMRAADPSVQIDIESTLEQFMDQYDEVTGS